MPNKVLVLEILAWNPRCGRHPVRGEVYEAIQEIFGGERDGGHPPAADVAQFGCIFGAICPLDKG